MKIHILNFQVPPSLPFMDLASYIRRNNDVITYYIFKVTRATFCNFYIYYSFFTNKTVRPSIKRTASKV